MSERPLLFITGISGLLGMNVAVRELLRRPPKFEICGNYRTHPVDFAPVLALLRAAETVEDESNARPPNDDGG